VLISSCITKETDVIENAISFYIFCIV